MSPIHDIHCACLATLPIGIMCNSNSSLVECGLLFLIHTLNWHFNRCSRRWTSWLILGWHLIIYVKGLKSSWLLTEMLLMECWLSVNQGVDGVLIKGVDQGHQSTFNHGWLKYIWSQHFAVFIIVAACGRNKIHSLSIIILHGLRRIFLKIVWFLNTG